MAASIKVPAQGSNETHDRPAAGDLHIDVCLLRIESGRLRGDDLQIVRGPVAIPVERQF